MNALCILTDGFEEIEAITPIDLLRRAEVNVTLAALNGQPTVRGRCGVEIQTTTSLDAVTEKLFDLLLLPGGPGTTALRDDARVIELTRRHAAAGKWIAAICAAPTILHTAGLLEGHAYTAHDSVKDILPNLLEDEAVVRSGKLITSRGAGTAVPFALELVQQLAGARIADDIAESIHCRL